MSADRGCGRAVMEKRRDGTSRRSGSGELVLDILAMIWGSNIPLMIIPVEDNMGKENCHTRIIRVRNKQSDKKRKNGYKRFATFPSEVRLTWPS